MKTILLAASLLARVKKTAHRRFQHEVLLSVPLRNLRPTQKIHATLQQEQSTRNQRERAIFTRSESIPVAVERNRDRAQIRLTQTGSVSVEVGIQSIADFYAINPTPGNVPQTIRVCAEASVQISILHAQCCIH